MKIVFLGDSITDAGRNATHYMPNFKYGYGYVFLVRAALYKKDPLKYNVINVGISGNRIVDLYARIKADVWNHNPDVLSILIGINDVWHEIWGKNGVDIRRFEKVEKRRCFPAVQLGKELISVIELKNLLEDLVKPIVTDPDSVVIIEKKSGKDTLLQLNVAPADMGKVIGRHGKIAKAIRTIMKAAAISSNQHVRVDILDKDELEEESASETEE